MPQRRCSAYSTNRKWFFKHQTSLFGHVHRPVSGSWHGIPFNTLRGTNHQIQFDLNVDDYLPINHEPPAYCVIFLEPQQTTVHFHDYLDDSLYKKISLKIV